MSRPLRRLGDVGWEISIADGATRVAIDYGVTIATTDGYTFRIEQPFVPTDAEGSEFLLVPEGDPLRLCPVLALARTTVASARAFDDGRLELDLADGSTIRVPCGEDYEPWEAAGPSGLKIVAVPGGELSVWQ
ncbi:DUF6188 family protein [Cellulomonas massiliensis]|uniref:DUF6188 family protein n=1 Tax=Cellulomonas massiliensis TaxID=1465811 RepID=UPI001FE642E0|nr:DUF6188 family protein [Cellulomonas massiliensis]